MPILINNLNKGVTKLGKLEEPETKQASTVGAESELSKFTYTKDDTAKTVTITYINTTGTSLTIYSQYSIGGTAYRTIISKQSEYSPIISSSSSLRTLVFQEGVEIKSANVLLQGAPIETVDMRGVEFTSTRMDAMFQNCTSLTSVDMSNCNTYNVTDMNHMFHNCQKLTEIKIGNFNVSNVEYIESMFEGCSSLTTLNLSSFTTLKGDIRRMFYGCSSLTNLNISNLNTSEVECMHDLFNGCSSLQTLDLSNFEMNSNLAASDLLTGCSSLNTLITPKVGNTKISLSQTMYDENGTSYTYFPSTSKTLYKEKPATYTIKYNANGGSGSMSNSTHTCGVDSKLSKNTFTKTGYSFLGWTFEEFKDTFSSANFADEATVSEKELFETGEIVEIVELYAVWYPNTYTIKYNANGGSGSMSDSKHAYGAENIGVQAKLSKNTFTRSGYKFKGWSKSSTATTASYSDEEVVRGLTSEDKGTVVLYAVWELNTHTVIFKDGTTTKKTETVENGKGATAPTLTKTGYTLSWDKAFNNVTSDLTVNAVWTANTNTPYKVEYYIRTLDNEVVGYQLYETENLNGTTDTLATAIVKTYVGCTENITIVDRVPSGNIEGNGSLVLKLYYDRNVYKIDYKLNGGITSNTLDKTYTYGEEIILSTRVEKEGYTFAGWYENEECTGEAITKIQNTETGDKTYYAKWIKQQEIPFTISSQEYEILNLEKYISKVKPGTTVQTFMNNITTNGSMKVVNSKGEEMQNEQLVGTGYKLKVEYKGTEYEYEVAVRGDIDGNGKITATDLSTLNQALIKKITLTGIRKKAADIDYNGEITATDLSTLNQAVIKKITL